ncbi:NADPH-dependent F420 reductase [Demequina aurantiaca]|uniref:NADPH-dependent F420 reductase n=1 Tax=Demequina aurantiaca TaxID=676200 RepID=UPI003D357EE3
MSTTRTRQYSPSASSSQTLAPLARTVAIFGAGRVGTALARSLVAAGYDVRVVGSGPPSGIALIIDVLAPGAVAMAARDAVHGADVVILAVPLHKVDTVAPELLRGKVVVDVMNYWEPVDGRLADFADGDPTTQVVSTRFAGAEMVKAFNHIGYHEIETDRRESGHHERRALAVAGDSRAAVELVLEMVHRIGFDAVDGGGLAQSGALEAGGPVFGVRLSRPALERHLAFDGEPTH